MGRNPHKKFSKEMEERIIYLYKGQRKSCNKIGKLLHISPSSVIRVLRRNDVKSRTLSEAHREVTPEIIEKWRHLRKVEDLSHSKIAERFSVSAGTVRLHLKFLGVDTSSPINTKLTYIDAQERGEERGLKLLVSKEEFNRIYKNYKTKLPWECLHGHKTSKAVGSVHLYGCRLCWNAQREVIINLETLQETGKSRGGGCLATKPSYNITNKVGWYCANGHQWEAIIGAVLKKRSWCPHCGVSIGEEICRRYFETIFKKPFPRTKPKWLKGNRGYVLELDGYSKELGITFEHHGRHHYEQVHWSVSREKLAARKKLDQLKRKECEACGITLIAIPEVNGMLPLSDLRAYIKEECLKAGIKLPKNYDMLKINLNKLPKESRLQKLKRVSLENGIECLATTWLGVQSRYQFLCVKCGHRWTTPASVILHQGSGCPKCVRVQAGLRISKTKMTKNSEKKLERLKSASEEAGVEFLEEEYKGTSAKYIRRCKQCNHKWETLGDSILIGRGCPECRWKKGWITRRKLN